MELKILSVALILNVTLNYFLIPVYGASALAGSMLASETFCFIGCFVFFLYHFRGPGFEIRPQTKK